MVVKVGSDKPADFLNMTSVSGVHEILGAISKEWNSSRLAPAVAALGASGLIQAPAKTTSREIKVDVLADAGVQLIDSSAAKTNANVALGQLHKAKGGHEGHN